MGGQDGGARRLGRIPSFMRPSASNADDPESLVAQSSAEVRLPHHPPVYVVLAYDYEHGSILLGIRQTPSLCCTDTLRSSQPAAARQETMPSFGLVWYPRLFCLGRLWQGGKTS